MMSTVDIFILAGSCGAGRGTYDVGVFHMPDGTARGVEDLTDLSASANPDVVTSPRRSGIARGLRDALAASLPLPRPLDLAASVLEIGLDVLGPEGRSGPVLELRFADGATTTIRIDAAGAARIVRDREVVRLAALRRAAVPQAPGESVAEGRSSRAEPDEGAPSEIPGPDARALASIFAYEKRGGRLRRRSAKAPDEA